MSELEGQLNSLQVQLEASKKQREAPQARLLEEVQRDLSLLRSLFSTLEQQYHLIDANSWRARLGEKPLPLRGTDIDCLVADTRAIIARLHPLEEKLLLLREIANTEEAQGTDGKEI